MRLATRFRSRSPMFDEIGVAGEPGMAALTFHQTDAGVYGRMGDDTLSMGEAFPTNL